MELTERLCRECTNPFSTTYPTQKLCSPPCAKISRTRQMKAAQIRNRDRYRLGDHARAIKSKYGITIEEYNALALSQGNRCAICRVHQIELKKRLSVDHNHTTGAVRGLLCNNCNVGIGVFMDKPELLIQAIKYLTE